MKTPDSVIAELTEHRKRYAQGVSELMKARLEATEAKLAFSKAKAITYIKTQGTIADRNAMTALQTEAEEKAFEDAKTKVEYINDHLEMLRLAQMSLQTESNLIQLMYRNG